MNIEKKLEFDFSTTQKVVAQIGEIEKFQGKWELLERSDNEFLKELRQVATIQSIGSSTRIEGSMLSDIEVRTLLNNLNIKELETRDEQEVIGYWEALELILENASEIPLSENYVFQLHSLLLKYSSKDVRYRGNYKTIPNRVVATYPDGSERVIFHTTPPHLVEKEMQELIHWTNIQLESKDINPLIVIATFVYEFLSIHPFHDGNGRLSRLLTTLLLVKKEYYYVQYVSFEHAIEEKKKEYYQVLMECQRKRGTEEEKIGKWVDFFLDRMIDLAKKLEIKLDQISHHGEYFNARQKKILSLLKVKGAMKLSDVSHEFDTVSIHTIKKDLQLLSSKKVIVKKGRGKGTVYELDLLNEVTFHSELYQ